MKIALFFLGFIVLALAGPAFTFLQLQNPIAAFTHALPGIEWVALVGLAITAILVQIKYKQDGLTDYANNKIPTLFDPLGIYKK